MLAVFVILICVLPLSGHAQYPDTCNLTTTTDRGEINLELLLYDINALNPEDPLESQTIVGFQECDALGVSDPNLPPPFGEFPYGLWRSKINLTSQFDPNTHRIVMKIYFPGPIDPLNAQYWAQEYDVEEERIEWEEFGQSEGLFLPNVSERSITIRLSDSRPSDIPGDAEPGLGDQDPNEGMIDHLGGLLWPIPYGGRCFMDH